jgi:hypothetical protein
MAARLLARSSFLARPMGRRMMTSAARLGSGLVSPAAPSRRDAQATRIRDGSGQRFRPPPCALTESAVRWDLPISPYFAHTAELRTSL